MATLDHSDGDVGKRFLGVGHVCVLALVLSLALPVAMAADDAKALALRMSAEAALARRVTRLPQGFAALAVPPGVRAQWPGEAATMLVDERRIEGAGVVLTLRTAPLATASPSEADSGRVLATPDLIIGQSVAHLFDLPSAGVADRMRGRLVLAAAGTGAGWRGASVSMRARADAPMVDIGAVRPAAVLGVVESLDSTAVSGLIDHAGAISVALTGDDMVLANASDADLLAGANLAIAGSELMQFGHAEPMGGGQWRLTRLMRGRFGTENAMAGLAIGHGFALIADPALMMIDSDAGFALDGWGEGAVVTVAGQGDAVPLSLPVTAYGRAMRPLSPAHGAARWQAGGGFVLTWVRRSRDGFGWTDGIDAPIDERSERYRVTLSAGAQQLVVETGVPELALPLTDVTAWQAIGPNLNFAIVQLGERGESVALTGIVPLN